MIFRAFTVILILLVGGQLFAQENLCGTSESPDPTFDVIEFQAFKKRMQKEQQTKSTIYIPIKPHVIRTSAGSGGLSDTQVLDAIATMNSIYSSSGIVFFLCNGINHIDNSTLFDYDANTESSLISQYYHVDALNIFFFNTVISTSGNSVCGFAHLPWGSNQLDDYVAMKNSCAVNGSTLSHEVGHFFGLYHTHSSSNGVEMVNGSNCSSAGDLCCDTPADPQLSTTSVNTSCVYTEVTADSNGDQYAPDPTNIMSYSRKSCRDNLTQDQFTRVLYYQSNSRNYLTCTSPGDINLSNFSIDTNLVYVEEHLLFSVEQNYLGAWYSADLPAVNINFYLSKDTIFDTTDILLKTDSSEIGTDITSDTLSGELMVPSDISSGEYYVIAWGDSEDFFAENNESNNFLFTKVTIVNDLVDHISIFPNPTRDLIHYEANGEDIKNIEVLNNIGQQVLMTSNIDGQLDFSKLAIGSYVIKFTNSNDDTSVYHVIKQ